MVVQASYFSTFFQGSMDPLANFRLGRLPGDNWVDPGKGPWIHGKRNYDHNYLTIFPIPNNAQENRKKLRFTALHTQSEKSIWIYSTQCKKPARCGIKEQHWCGILGKFWRDCWPLYASLLKQPGKFAPEVRLTVAIHNTASKEN